MTMILAINKIDVPGSDPMEIEEKIFEQGKNLYFY